MTLYSVALFLHIVGALGFFVALGIEWTALLHLRRATTTEQTREWLGVFAGLRGVASISEAAILLPGLYMAATTWGIAAWIATTLAAWLLIGILGTGLTGRLIAPIRAAVFAHSGVLPPALSQDLRDPRLWISIQTRTAIALGIVFLMSVKPGLAGSLLAIGVAVALGLALAFLTSGRSKVKDAAV
ncbi:MAG TPA: hypothetical protein VER55_06990 [Ardenticatenaceae bacterium]|nr:hypothetical protein [Ardenticatenaceae bacterium]